MKKTLLVDCDDVLEDLCSPWINELNKIANTDYTVDDVNDWSIKSLFPQLTDEQVFGVLTKEKFWKKVKPIDGAQKYLRLLQSEGYEIYVVTATHYSNFAYKIVHIINKYFPFIPESNIIAIHKKQLLKGDYLVDDNPKNLINGNYTKLLFTAPHNRNYEAVWPYSDLYRVNNWQEVYRLVHEF